MTIYQRPSSLSSLISGMSYVITPVPGYLPASLNLIIPNLSIYTP